MHTSVFPAPYRKAVYEETEEKQKQANLEELGKKLSRQTIGIIPKIRELDEFLLKNKHYQNQLMESHPEVCFVSMSGYNLTSKHYIKGIIDRIELLAKYLPEVTLDFITEEMKKNKCKESDIVDAICLVITANLHKQNKTEILPFNQNPPQKDAKGLPMQMVVLSFYHANDNSL